MGEFETHEPEPFDAEAYVKKHQSELENSPETIPAQLDSLTQTEREEVLDTFLNNFYALLIMLAHRPNTDFNQQLLAELIEAARRQKLEKGFINKMRASQHDEKARKKYTTKLLPVYQELRKKYTHQQLCS